MRLIFAGNRYLAVSSFDERAIPKAAGFRWDPDRKRWYTTDPAVASKLAEHADDTCREALRAAARQRESRDPVAQQQDAIIRDRGQSGLIY